MNRFTHRWWGDSRPPCLHIDDGGGQTHALHFDDGEAKISSGYRFRISHEERRFYITHRWRGASHQMYFGAGDILGVVKLLNSSIKSDIAGE